MFVITENIVKRPVQSHGTTNTTTPCHIKLRCYLNIAAIYYYFAESNKP